MSKTTVSASATGLPSSDPIFSALEKFRIAQTAYDEAQEARKKVEYSSSQMSRPFKFLAKMADKELVVSYLPELTEWLKSFAPDHAEPGIREIGALAEKFYGVRLPARPPVDPEKIKQWEQDRDAVIKSFNQAEQEYDDKRRDSGFDAAMDRVNETWIVYDAAEEEILQTKPTTPAGGVALVHFCAEYLVEHEDWERVAAALVNATGALAGTAEVIISKRLASVYARNLPADEAKTDQPRELVESYQTWLFHEYHAMCDELSPEGKFRRGDWTYCNNAGDRFHFVGYGENPKPLPSTRAAAVLAAVGCDWREEDQ